MTMHFEAVVSTRSGRTSEPEFLNFSGPQASIPQNRVLVRINSIVELIPGGGEGGPKNEVDSSFKN